MKRFLFFYFFIILNFLYSQSTDPEGFYSANTYGNLNLQGVNVDGSSSFSATDQGGYLEGEHIHNGSDTVKVWTAHNESSWKITPQPGMKLSYSAEYKYVEGGSGAIGGGLAIKQNGQWYVTHGEASLPEENFKHISGNDLISTSFFAIEDGVDDLNLENGNEFEVAILTVNGSFDGYENKYQIKNLKISWTSGCNECVSCAGNLGSTSYSNSNQPLISQSTGGGSLQTILPIEWSNENLTSLNNVFLNKGSESDEILSRNEYIHQVKNTEGLSWIKEIDENSYEVHQYDISKVGPKDVEGYYTITGNPDTKLTFSKTASTPNQVNVREEKGGNVISNTSFEYIDTDKTWVMGRDNDGDGTFESFEKTLESEDGNDKIKIFHLYDGSNQLVSKVQKTYDTNYNLTEEIVDPDTAALKTSYTYDDNNNQTRVDYPDGTWETTTYTVDDKPELITRSSGRFIKYEYDGSNRVIKKVESFNGSEESPNDNEHKVTTYDYTPVVAGDSGSVEPNEARTVCTSWQ